MDDTVSKSKSSEEKHIEPDISSHHSNAPQHTESAPVNMNDLDISIFKHIDNNECNTSDHTQCTMIQRLIVSLKYYSKLNIIYNENHKEIFRNFMMEIYCTFINDYNHFKNIHSNNLEEIYTLLIENKIFNECNITKCNFSSRHYRRTDINEDTISDPYLDFYKDNMDSFHFYLFHCFDVGLRIKKDINNDIKIDEFDDKNKDQYFDYNFARINQRILERENITSNFDRFSTKNSKYTIATEIKTDNEGNIMYLDHLFMYLIKSKVNNTDIKTLYLFIQYYEYDTDSIEFDHDFKTDGNIAKNTKNKQCLNEYDEFITVTKVSSSSFSVGLRYYYWEYYKKDLNDMEIISQFVMNHHDHSGYNYKELFVSAKYNSFKDEIHNYKYISIKSYNKIVVKVKLLLESEFIRKTVAITEISNWMFVHYGINYGDPLSFNHLLSLTLYTDCSDLCTAFSGSFRQNTPFETLNNTIQRNSSYYWMSRYLRELVEIYGENGMTADGDIDRRYNAKGTYLSGPFYCGMDMVMNMDSFTLRLCGPTSTSKQIEVALKFSGSQGMVLQLNNPDIFPHFIVFAFDASLISKYPEEDERVFIGGLFPIQIQSVRIRSTKQNFEEFIYSLYCLDLLMNRGNAKDIDLNKCNISTIKALMNTSLSLNKSTEKPFHDYIHSTFAAFTQNKTKIVLHLEELYKLNGKLRDLIMNKMEQRKPNKEEKTNDRDSTNLLKSQIFKIFKNIQSIWIQCGDEYLYSFSMMHLLSLIESHKINKVRVTTFGESNWIDDLWSSSSDKLIKEYEYKKYIINKVNTTIATSIGGGFLVNFVINKRT